MDEVIIEMQERIEELEGRVIELENYVDIVDSIEEWVNKVRNTFDLDAEDDIKLVEKKEEPKRVRTVQEIRELRPKWIEEGKQERELMYQKQMVSARLDLDEQIENTIKHGERKVDLGDGRCMELETKSVNISVNPLWADRFEELLKKEGFNVIRENQSYVIVQIPCDCNGRCDDCERLQ